MKRKFTSKRGWTVAALLIAVAATWYALSSKPVGCVSVRFTGYAFETPSLSLGSLSYGGEINPARKGPRVAKFFITNGCDFTVDCGFSARYTNGFGSFYPRNLSLEPHGVANISGAAGPPKPSMIRPMGPRVGFLSLPSDSTPSEAEWTNSWRLSIASRSALPLTGLAEKRHRTAQWLAERKLHRLSQYFDPVKIQVAETDPIPPDLR